MHAYEEGVFCFFEWEFSRSYQTTFLMTNKHGGLPEPIISKHTKAFSETSPKSIERQLSFKLGEIITIMYTAFTSLDK